jgi:HSP20 family protein
MIPISFGREFPVGFSPLLKEFERWFGDLDGYGQQTGAHSVPELISLQDKDGYTVTADVPGLTDKDLSVDLHRGVLTISGHRELATPENFEVTRRERSSLNFSRSLRLPDEVDEERVNAAVKDGVLTITLPRQEAVKPRQIPIKVH